MRIRQIRNATLAIDYAGSRILVDPWLEAAGMGMRATSPWPENNKRRLPLVELPCPVEEVLAGVDAVVVTYVHPDHFEQKTAALMDHALPLFVQDEADRAAVAAWGFADVRILSDEGSAFGAFALIRVPNMASRRRPTAVQRAVWCSRHRASSRSTLRATPCGMPA